MCESTRSFPQPTSAIFTLKCLHLRSFAHLRTVLIKGSVGDSVEGMGPFEDGQDEKKREGEPLQQRTCWLYFTPSFYWKCQLERQENGMAEGSKWKKANITVARGGVKGKPFLEKHTHQNQPIVPVGWSTVGQTMELHYRTLLIGEAEWPGAG